MNDQKHDQQTDSAVLGGDARLVRTRGDRSRATRDVADDLRENRDATALSVQERRRMLRDSLAQTVLPTPPKIPGFHLCWLSTTNSTDPIYKRVQLGYELVRQSEVAGFEQFKVTGGEFDGCVACNEMVLSKLPDALYQDLMTIFHHDMPLEQEQAIKERVLGQQNEDSTGRPLSTVEGDFNRLGVSPVRNPTFV